MNNTQAKQANIPEDIVNLITNNIKIVIGTLTTYIEKKLNEVTESIVEFVLGIQYNTTDSKDRPLLSTVANNTAKKMLNIKLQIEPKNNQEMAG